MNAAEISRLDAADIVALDGGDARDIILGAGSRMRKPPDAAPSRHFVDFLDLGDAEGAHRGADIARTDEDTLLLQPHEGRADEMPRMTEAFEQSFLASRSPGLDGRR